VITIQQLAARLEPIALDALLEDNTDPDVQVVGALLAAVMGALVSSDTLEPDREILMTLSCMANLLVRERLERIDARILGDVWRDS
jgi:hypothetical protein